MFSLRLSVAKTICAQLFLVNAAILLVFSPIALQGQSKKAPIKSPTSAKSAYERDRQRLLVADSLRAFDASITLSNMETLANQKLMALQSSMLHYYDSVHFFPPSHHFFKSKDAMQNTPLFALLKKMPKGGVHHIHPSAGTSFRWVVQRAITEKDCYVFWGKDAGDYIHGELGFFRADKVPSGFFPASRLNDSIPNFAQELYDVLTFGNEMLKDTVNIWGEFEKRFQRIEKFVSYQPVFEDFYTSLFDTLATDGVQHVEIRSHLGDNLYDLNHPPGTFDADSVIRYIQNAVRRVQASKEPDFTCKIIYTSVRFFPVATIKADLVRAFKLRKRYPSLIKAYDLVAHEDKGYPTRFYLDAWMMADSLSKVFNINLPFCFHDGESDWQHVSNVYDALLLNTSRLGHGFNISFFPAAETMALQKRVCIEVSPLSNQILGYIGDLRVHPAHSWIKHGIQISINSDDPAIFGYSGVTPDYWSIFLAWELDLRSLKKLVMNSIVYSLLDEAEKKKAMAVWQKKWNVFVKALAEE